MKVNELIEKINTSEEINFKEVLEIKEYLPIAIKKAIAQEIVYESTYDDNGFIKVDSFERYMSYVRHMIVYHTNLEYTDDDYDMLCSTIYKESTVLETIMSCFSKDAKECSRILDMITGDYMQETTLGCVIIQALNNIKKDAGELTKKLLDSIPADAIKNTDLNKLNDFVSKL